MNSWSILGGGSSRPAPIRALRILGFGLALALLASPAPGQESVLRLRPPVPQCPVCDLWLRYEDIVLQAQQEVGSLHDGVFYFYHASDPSVIEPLIRLAHEREELEYVLLRDPSKRRTLGEACGHRRHSQLGIELETSTSARGMVALLRARSHPIVEELRSEASRAVRGKIPVWF